MQSIEVRQTDIMGQAALAMANQRVQQPPVSINDHGRRDSWHIDVAWSNNVNNTPPRARP